MEKICNVPVNNIGITRVIVWPSALVSGGAIHVFGSSPIQKDIRISINEKYIWVNTSDKNNNTNIFWWTDF